MTHADFAEVETVEVEEKSSALVVFEAGTLVEYSDKILDQVERVAVEARARVAGADVSTPEGREVIRSTAYKVARTKTLLDDYGKQLTDEQKRTAAAVDKSRREMRDKLDDVKDEIRKPLTEFEEREARRVAEHEAALADIEKLLSFSDFAPRTSIELKHRLSILRGLPSRDWQEFKMRAQEAMVYAERMLLLGIAAAEKAEREAAAFARVQRETAERAQRERDERIAREAADKAKRDAEAAAAAEQRNRDFEAAAEILRAQERTAKAEQAAAKAERDAADAVKREQERVAAAQAAEDAATAKREANKKHRAKINGAARDALVVALKGLVDQGIAAEIVIAIASDKIPHVTISY